MLSVCGEITEDDGVDPRELARARMLQHQPRRVSAKSSPSEPSRKAKQLSRQVAETIDSLLSGEVRDPLLSSLRVVSAVPAPDSSRFLVELSPRVTGESIDPSAALRHLRQLSGWLRTEVARSITRRNAPTLVFQVNIQTNLGETSVANTGSIVDSGQESSED